MWGSPICKDKINSLTSFPLFFFEIFDKLEVFVYIFYICYIELTLETFFRGESWSQKILFVWLKTFS